MPPADTDLSARLTPASDPVERPVSASAGRPVVLLLTLVEPAVAVVAVAGALSGGGPGHHAVVAVTGETVELHGRALCANDTRLIGAKRLDEGSDGVGAPEPPVLTRRGAT